MKISMIGSKSIGKTSFLNIACENISMKERTADVKVLLKSRESKNLILENRSFSRSDKITEMIQQKE